MESPRMTNGRKCHIERWIYAIIDSHDEETIRWSPVGLMIACSELFSGRARS